jgi:hypothetical protein
LRLTKNGKKLNNQVNENSKKRNNRQNSGEYMVMGDKLKKGDEDISFGGSL